QSCSVLLLPSSLSHQKKYSSIVNIIYISVNVFFPRILLSFSQKEIYSFTPEECFLPHTRGMCSPSHQRNVFSLAPEKCIPLTPEKKYSLTPEKRLSSHQILSLNTKLRFSLCKTKEQDAFSLQKPLL
ncbi:hypothetical protein OTU49_000668, partial [Cherax quadricarinatus]